MAFDLNPNQRLGVRTLSQALPGEELRSGEDPKDPWFYNRGYLETLSSWPGRTPEEIRADLPKYVLILAAMSGDSFQIQRILVSGEAKIDDRVPEYAGTAFWYACHKGYYDLVDYLLDGSPDMYAVNYETGTTPYQEAKGECLKLMDKKLAAINAKKK